MKNTLKLSIPFYISLVLSILVGRFKLFIFITMITLFHELGHIIAGLLLNYKIEKVIVLPLGCLTIFNRRVNSSDVKDFIVTIMGPLFQMLLFFFIKQDYYLKYNLYLLIFNLIPIYPLDGYRLFNIFLYKLIPFKVVNDLSLYFSFVLLLVLFVLRPTNLLIYLICFVYVIQIIKEFKNNKYIFHKFLFERYLYNLQYRRRKFIKEKKTSKMYKNRTHMFLIENKLVKEEELLAKMFDNP